MTHPLINAAKAAYAEVSTPEAKAFFQSVAIAHTLMMIFVMNEAIVRTINVGKMTRSFVEDWKSTPATEQQTSAVTVEEPAPTWVCSGLLSAAKSEISITTSEIETNQGRLEQFIINNIQGIYEESISTNDGNDLGDRKDCPIETTTTVDVAHAAIHSSVEVHPPSAIPAEATPTQGAPKRRRGKAKASTVAG